MESCRWTLSFHPYFVTILVSAVGTAEREGRRGVFLAGERVVALPKVQFLGQSLPGRFSTSPQLVARRRTRDDRRGTEVKLWPHVPRSHPLSESAASTASKNQIRKARRSLTFPGSPTAFQTAAFAEERVFVHPFPLARLPDRFDVTPYILSARPKVSVRSRHLAGRASDCTGLFITVCTHNQHSFLPAQYTATSTGLINYSSPGLRGRRERRRHYCRVMTA